MSLYQKNFTVRTQVAEKIFANLTNRLQKLCLRLSLSNRRSSAVDIGVGNQDNAVYLLVRRVMNSKSYLEVNIMDDKELNDFLNKLHTTGVEGEDLAPIIRWFEARLIRQVQAQLNSDGRKSRSLEAEDVIQSLFLRIVSNPNEALIDISTKQHLANRLAQSARRLCSDKLRRETAQKRGGITRRGESAFEGNGSQESNAGIANFAVSDEKPECAILEAELIEMLIGQLDTDENRLIARLWWNGSNKTEIAKTVGKSLSAISRKVINFYKLWRQLNINDA